MLVTLRMLALATLGAAGFIALALFFVVPPVALENGPEAYPPPWVPFGVAVVVVVLVGLLIEAVGYRAPRPTAPGTPPKTAARQSAQVFLSLGVVRVALAELPTIVGVAAAFLVASYGFEVFLGFAAGGVLLGLVHALPGERAIRKVEGSLERAGGASMLRQGLGV